MVLSSRSRGAAQTRAEQSYVTRRLVLPLQRFLYTETSSGILLLLSAVAALIWANGSWSASYENFWHTPVSVQIGGFSLAHDLREWINDALMVLFFFVVGIEVKREVKHGELAGVRRAALPVIAALGGMLVPALLYASLNWRRAGSRGWGIPMATDIAFALGVLALAGKRVPASARVFLLALATVDDIGAILVIAVAYTERVAAIPLLSAVFLVAVIIGMRRFGVMNLLYYVPVAALFWFAVMQSGVHATIAGVVLGLLMPTEAYFSPAVFVGRAAHAVGNFDAARSRGDSETAAALLGELDQLTAGTESPAERVLRLLHPWSSFLVLPLFALANAGVPLSAAVVGHALSSRITLGVVLGLLLGKAVGITLFTLLAVRLRVVRPIHGLSTAQLAGIGLLGGIGFTVSLFIADLAFAEPALTSYAKTGILLASVMAAVAGYLALRFSSPAQAGSSTLLLSDTYT